MLIPDQAARQGGHEILMSDKRFWVDGVWVVLHLALNLGRLGFSDLLPLYPRPLFSELKVFRFAPGFFNPEHGILWVYQRK